MVGLLQTSGKNVPHTRFHLIGGAKSGNVQSQPKELTTRDNDGYTTVARRKMPAAKSIVIAFAPERWGTLELFQHFYGNTHHFDRDTQKSLPGTANHFNKALILFEVAKQHVTLLSEDRTQLTECGYTSARRGRELSALLESALLDLYSSIDCTRKVVTFIYRKHGGVKQSTRKFFQSAAGGTIGTTVPEGIRKAFACATWYTDFRVLRDAITHSDVGSCHSDEKSGKVFYLHAGLERDGKNLVIEDIFDHIDKLKDSVNQFMGQVFQCLNADLKDDEVWQMCGVFDGRIYSRLVRPSEAIDFNSGRCDAFAWFEKEENPVCPFMQECLAYRRKTDEESTTSNPDSTSAQVADGR